MLDRSEHIDSDHLRAALGFWQFAEDSARFIFGGLTTEQRNMLSFLKAGAKTKTEFYSALFQRHRLSADIESDLKVLIGAGKVREKHLAGKTIYVATEQGKI